MASIGTDKRGNRYVQFEDVHRRRRTLRLGKVSKRDAETVRLRVERIVAAKVANSAIDADTARWVDGIGDRLRQKMVAFDLVSSRNSALLGEFVTQYVTSRTDVAPSTRKDWGPTFQSLKDHFGERKDLRDINGGQAVDWIRSLSPRLEENTIRKYTKNAKTLFSHAQDHRLIEQNPFSGNASTTKEVVERFYFVTQQQAQAVLKACPDVRWRAIFALARYGGLRCPSEVLSVRWGDVLWDQDRMTVPKYKTKQRTLPLFPQLRTVLEEAFDLAPEGSEFIVDSAGNNSSNLRTTMTKIVKRAGLEPWPKLFQNLRSSRETELVDEGYNIKVVCGWIGNSPQVALKHYLQMTEAHFASATGKSAANALQSNAESERTALKPELETTVFTDSCSGVHSGSM